MSDPENTKPKDHHPAVLEILRYFEWQHLPPHLQTVSAAVSVLANSMADKLEGPELTVGLRKLLEAKDCFVRAALPRTAVFNPKALEKIAEVGADYIKSQLKEPSRWSEIGDPLRTALDKEKP